MSKFFLLILMFLVTAKLVSHQRQRFYLSNLLHADFGHFQRYSMPLVEIKWIVVDKVISRKRSTRHALLLSWWVPAETFLRLVPRIDASGEQQIYCHQELLFKFFQVMIHDINGSSYKIGMNSMCGKDACTILILAYKNKFSIRKFDWKKLKRISRLFDLMTLICNHSYNGSNSCLCVKFGSCRNMLIRLYYEIVVK